VAAGANCTISVSFTPTAAGPRSGAVTIMDSAAGSPHGISLSGTGNNPNTPPVASFISACIGLTCTFNGTASSDADGTIAGYVWRFGDGTDGAALATVSHTYAAGGTYSVTLTVTDNGGAKSTQTASVNVSPPVIPYMHVGDLDRTTTKQGNTWTAIVTVTIHDGSQSGVSNATVIWSSGGTGSCTTNASGKCTVSKSGISKNTASVTFAVGNVTHSTFSYKEADNQDSDGDSSGTSITVNRP
jgi:PKD repeat protein